MDVHELGNMIGYLIAGPYYAFFFFVGAVVGKVALWILKKCFYKKSASRSTS